MSRIKTITIAALILAVAAPLCSAAMIQTWYWRAPANTNNGRTQSMHTAGDWFTDPNGTVGNEATSLDSVVIARMTDADPNTAFVLQPIAGADYGMAIRNTTNNANGESITVTAPFTFKALTLCPTGQGVAADANFPLMNAFNYVFEFGDCGTNTNSDLVYTFNDLKFQGTVRAFRPSGAHLAGKMALTGPTAFSVRTGQGLYLDAEMDAGALGLGDLRNQFYERDVNTPAAPLFHVTNGNNKFYGTWVLDSQLYADTAGCLGDADVTINGAGTPLRDTDRRSGLLNITTANAIASTAKLVIGDPTPYNTSSPFSTANPQCTGARLYIAPSPGTITVRELWVNGTQKTSGTYSFGTANPWLANGSVVVSGTATQTLTMSGKINGVTDPNCKTFPPFGMTKAYARGYVVKIIAVTPIVVNGKGYSFSSWTVVGGSVANASAASTTITMPSANVTITANYTFAATNPTPANGATGITTDGVNLQWTPVIGAARQDIYLGLDSSSLPALLSNQSGSLNTAATGALEDTRTYYWRVDTDSQPGTVWSFSTAQRRPYNPTPAVGATGIDIHNPKLKWTQGQASPTSWDIYLGTSSGTMTKIATKTAPYDPNGVSAGDPLAVSKTYYWRVDEKPVPANTVATGVVWNFVTRAPICTNSPTADMNGDCRVTFADFALVANDWRK